MQEFNPDSETLTTYLERFQMFVATNGIDDSKLVPGAKTDIESHPGSESGSSEF